MEKVLVTGADGYLGACIFNQLLNDKNKIVHKLKGRLHEITPSSLDYDLVIHCAGALRHRKGQHAEANSEGTKKLIDGLKGNAKIIYISSKSIYGTKKRGTVNENTFPQPDDDYGKSKYKGELLVFNSGSPYIIIRSSTLYGLGVNNPGRAFPFVAMHKLYTGHDIEIYIPDPFHEYLYVMDLANIVLKLLRIPQSWNNVFNVAGPKQSLISLITSIEKYLKTNATTIGNVHKITKERNDGFFMDCTKLERFISETYFTPTDTIVKRMGKSVVS